MNDIEELERENIKLRQQIQNLDDFNLSLYRVYRAARQFCFEDMDREKLLDAIGIVDAFIGKS